MKFDKVLLWFLSVIVTFSGVLSLNILAVFPYQGKSHFFVFEPYLKQLANRGHNLTVISYFPQENPIANYNDISLAGKMKILESVFPIHRSYWTILQMIFFLNEMGRENCKILLADENVQTLWKSKTKFDVVVTETFNSDCALGLAHNLKAPVVGMTSHILLPWHYDRFGIQYNPTFMPMIFLEGGTKPSLYQRIERLILHYFSKMFYKYYQSINEYELRQYFEVPSLEELARETKIMLVYSSFVVNEQGLYPPNFIQVGGYHVAKPRELPKDLKQFIEEAEHGVIYISFGTMLQAASTPKDVLKAIVEVISELPQRVIWKWDEKTLPGNPKDVYLAKWLPQNDILAHPNVLAFYSHCGMLGTTEAIYHGVPMVGMPVFGDQPANAAAIEESGLGVQIQIKDLTKESLLEKFKTVLNPEFRRKVEDLSRIWHDRPVSAIESAIYWTEFAARTRNHTFRSPATTVFLYQYFNLDIVAVLIVILLLIIFSFKLIISSLRTQPETKSKKIKTK